MSIYYCGNCQVQHDNDYVPCDEREGELVCADSTVFEDSKE
jgi:hypothetical protein